MSGDGAETVALWYYSHGPCYMLFDTEQEAADCGTSLEDGDDPATVLGAQFTDGQVIRREVWPEFDAAEGRRYARIRQELAEYRSRPPVPVREALDPFDGNPVKIRLSGPSWLGKQ